MVFVVYCLAVQCLFTLFPLASWSLGMWQPTRWMTHYSSHTNCRFGLLGWLRGGESEYIEQVYSGIFKALGHGLLWLKFSLLCHYKVAW